MAIVPFAGSPGVMGGGYRSVMRAAEFVGPLRRVDADSPAVSCRDMALGWHDLRRSDWWEAQRDQHGNLDAPDWLPCGGVYGIAFGNRVLAAQTVSRV